MFLAVLVRRVIVIDKKLLIFEESWHIGNVDIFQLFLGGIHPLFTLFAVQ